MLWCDPARVLEFEFLAPNHQKNTKTHLRSLLNIKTGFSRLNVQAGAQFELALSVTAICLEIFIGTPGTEFISTNALFLYWSISHNFSRFIDVRRLDHPGT